MMSMEGQRSPRRTLTRRDDLLLDSDPQVLAVIGAEVGDKRSTE